MSTSRTLAATVALVTTLALAGCGSGDKKAGDNESPEAGPLQEFFNELYPSQDQGEMDEQQRKSEELVAECMKDLGWEYTPVDYSSIGGDYVDIYAEQDELGPIGWAKKYGYGWMTQQTGTDVDEEPTDEETSGDEFVDPNSDYVQSLGADEQTDYYADLYGEQSAEPTDEVDENGDPVPVEYNWEDAGCQGKANHEIYGSTEDIYSDPQYTSLMDEINTVYEDVQNDPDIAELDEKWAACMAKAGFDDIKTPDGVYDVLNTLQETLWDPETGEQAPNYDEALADAQKQEIDMAVADATCQKDLDYVKKRAKVQNKVEQAFVDSHADEMEQLRAAIKEATTK